MEFKPTNFNKEMRESFLIITNNYKKVFELIRYGSPSINCYYIFWMELSSLQRCRPLISQNWMKSIRQKLYSCIKCRLSFKRCHSPDLESFSYPKIFWWSIGWELLGSYEQVANDYLNWYLERPKTEFGENSLLKVLEVFNKLSSSLLFI